MADKLRPKYMVFRVVPDDEAYLAGSGMKSTDPEDVDSPFVLMPRKDSAAFAALLVYTEHCEPDLAVEIRSWLYKIVAAPPAFGTQGVRNRAAFRKRLIHNFGS